MTTNADWEATVAQWTSVYREVYDDQSTSRFAGWIDYVTGRRIPDAVMEAWLDGRCGPSGGCTRAPSWRSAAAPA